MRMPALAVVGVDHQIIRSTETFRRKCDNPVALCESSPELDLVLTGQTDTAVVDLGDFSVAIEAVTDAAGKRGAMLSVPSEELSADPESPLTALREAADQSPAIVWVKDIDGRYLYVNSRYEQDLETSEERLRGNTDADLPPVETVDGPRLRYVDDGLKEPLQLEYSVPPFESRPAMVAFRFPLRNAGGQPIATCGVAAPSSEATTAREEAVRLMQLERWNRLDPLDVRAELLEQWHVHPKPGPVEEAESNGHGRSLLGRAKASLKRAAGDEVASASPAVEEEPQTEAPAPAEPSPRPEASASAEEDTEAPAVTEPPPAQMPPLTDASAPFEADERSYGREDEWVRQLRQAAQMAADEAASNTADALQSDLQMARTWAERADQLQGDLHEAHAQIREAEAEAQQAIAAAQLASDEATRIRGELEQARLDLEREKGEAKAARSEAEAARRELGAARAQADSLRGPADAALRLSEELGRALAAERERGDELAHTLARIRARLGDLEGALEAGA